MEKYTKTSQTNKSLNFNTIDGSNGAQKQMYSTSNYNINEVNFCYFSFLFLHTGELYVHCALDNWFDNFYGLRSGGNGILQCASGSY